MEFTFKELLEFTDNEKNDTLKNGIRTSNHLLVFQESELVINFYSMIPSQSIVYEVDLERIVDVNSLLSWIFHLHGKAWDEDKEVINAFLTLFIYVVDVYFEDNICLDDASESGFKLNWDEKSIIYPEKT
ncbi:hypothetical protein [Pseudanabaena sp. Chao 1811]|uniref:hypothetical protein n=1 Tax=Pseudanabaena sp. Chao 1811 TaxID=2963092 RepID=UPI0022F3F4D9|nr:hypothetical protein [Pseudanabaena sp. Chao 1811]